MEHKKISAVISPSPGPPAAEDRPAASSFPGYFLHRRRSPPPGSLRRSLRGWSYPPPVPHGQRSAPGIPYSRSGRSRFRTGSGGSPVPEASFLPRPVPFLSYSPDRSSLRASGPGCRSGCWPPDTAPHPCPASAPQSPPRCSYEAWRAPDGPLPRPVHWSSASGCPWSLPP